MVYVDPARWPKRGKYWCHMTADTIEELHSFAARIGLRRAWFQASPKHPHYDMTDERRAVAVLAGAVEISSRELAKLASALAGNGPPV